MTDYLKLKDIIGEMLNKSRFEHSLRVEREAVKLGEKYGADINKCRIAALVHDCAKEFSDEELIKRARLYGMDIDPIQLASPQLLHGSVGAEYLKNEFEISDNDIYNSVAYHTTGRAGMSILEKIIYIADMTEEKRNFSGVEEIREASYVSLDKALYIASTGTIKYVLERGLLIHPLTIELRNSLLMGGNAYGK